VHFSIEGFLRLIAIKAKLKSKEETLGIGWLPHQPFHAFDDVSTPVFDRALVIVISSYNLESV